MRLPSLLHRASRLMAIASSPYPLSANALMQAPSIDELRGLADSHSGIGFNDQVLRIAYLCWLFRAVGCSSFMETGTYKGITARAAHELFETDVLTVEARLSAYWSSRLIALIARAHGIHFEFGDSARALGRWLSRLGQHERPMIYLDAHWLVENPLRRELAAAVARGNSVVVIDDCRVEGDGEFGFDIQSTSPGFPGPFTIELGSIIDLLPTERVVALQPAYAASTETGRKRGCSILLIDVPIPADDLSLVSTLFVPVSLVQGKSRPVSS